MCSLCVYTILHRLTINVMTHMSDEIIFKQWRLLLADQLQLLMDNTIKVKPTKENSASVARLEGLSRRLMFKLHIKRTKLLESDGDKIQTTMKKRI